MNKWPLVLQLETIEEDQGRNIQRAKFKVLNGWLQQNPEGNPRLVSISRSPQWNVLCTFGQI